MISDCVRRGLHKADDDLLQQLLTLGLDVTAAEHICRDALQLQGDAATSLHERLRSYGVKTVGLRLKVALALKQQTRPSACWPPNCIAERQPPKDVSAAELGKILRGEVNALDTPLTLTRPAADQPSAADAEHIRACVTDSSADRHRMTSVGHAGQPTVGIASDSDDVLQRWTHALSECGDPECGCNRIKYPTVRRMFRDLVVAETLKTHLPTRRAIRYTSIGSGHLLFDFELLSLFQKRGLRIEQVKLPPPFTPLLSIAPNTPLSTSVPIVSLPSTLLLPCHACALTELRHERRWAGDARRSSIQPDVAASPRGCRAARCLLRAGRGRGV